MSVLLVSVSLRVSLDGVPPGDLGRSIWRRFFCPIEVISSIRSFVRSSFRTGLLSLVASGSSGFLLLGFLFTSLESGAGLLALANWAVPIAPMGMMGGGGGGGGGTNDGSFEGGLWVGEKDPKGASWCRGVERPELC